MTCKKHPKYKAFHPPKANCNTCKFIWLQRLIYAECEDYITWEDGLDDEDELMRYPTMKG